MQKSRPIHNKPAAADRRYLSLASERACWRWRIRDETAHPTPIQRRPCACGNPCRRKQRACSVLAIQSVAICHLRLPSKVREAGAVHRSFPTPESAAAAAAQQPRESSQLQVRKLLQAHARVFGRLVSY